jgi:hypothetical protein
MDGNAKQLLSERIKNATNILVTVSRDPSVDELSAALALTFMLNKMDKHATAVFSGAIPPAIGFLQPEKTFEGTVDSLRDFIIALDKEKADRLRYKVEDDVVRIFITPYKTIISEKDLQFSQGDFNVELIVALGVEKREDLDNAITAHGRILHDATVATINATNQTSGLGSIDWTDGNVSSLCEMLMSLSESLQSGLLDQQISTALLTGIVAATDRFSNTQTTPRVMTMAAQLMAAGANQQLIATKLEEGNVLPASAPQPAPSGPDGSTKLTEGESQKVQQEQPKPDGEMEISHDKPQQPSAPPAQPAQVPNLTAPDAHTEEKMSTDLVESMPAQPNLSVDDLKKDLAAASEAVDEAASNPVQKGDWRSRSGDQMTEPSFGGTLNATTDEAAAEKRREEERNRNHRLLSHDGPSAGNTISPINGAMAAGNEPQTVDPFAEPPKSEPDSMMHYEATPVTSAEPPAPIEMPAPQPPQTPPAAPPAPAPEPPKPPELAPVNEPGPAGPHTPNLLDLEERAHEGKIVDENSSLSEARAAVDAALNNGPYKPEPFASAGATPFPAIEHQENHDVGAAAPPPPPPLPDFSTLPPLPGEQSAPQQTPPPAAAGTTPLQPTEPGVTPPAPAPVNNDPAQFKLPGQQ